MPNQDVVFDDGGGAEAKLDQPVIAQPNEGDAADLSRQVTGTMESSNEPTVLSDQEAEAAINEGLGQSPYEEGGDNQTFNAEEVYGTLTRGQINRLDRSDTNTAMREGLARDLNIDNPDDMDALIRQHKIATGEITSDAAGSPSQESADTPPAGETDQADQAEVREVDDGQVHFSDLDPNDPNDRRVINNLKRAVESDHKGSRDRLVAQFGEENTQTLMQEYYDAHPELRQQDMIDTARDVQDAIKNGRVPRRTQGKVVEGVLEGVGIDPDSPIGEEIEREVRRGGRGGWLGQVKDWLD